MKSRTLCIRRIPQVNLHKGCGDWCRSVELNGEVDKTHRVFHSQCS